MYIAQILSSYQNTACANTACRKVSMQYSIVVAPLIFTGVGLKTDLFFNFFSLVFVQVSGIVGFLLIKYMKELTTMPQTKLRIQISLKKTSHAFLIQLITASEKLKQ